MEKKKIIKEYLEPIVIADSIALFIARLLFGF